MENQYCPNGNYWEDISGIFDTKIYLFCDCNKCGGKIYVLNARDVINKIDPKVIERLKQDKILKEIKSKITKKNMESVKTFLKI